MITVFQFMNDHLPADWNVPWWKYAVGVVVDLFIFGLVVDE